MPTPELNCNSCEKKYGVFASRPIVFVGETRSSALVAKLQRMGWGRMWERGEWEIRNFPLEYSEAFMEEIRKAWRITKSDHPATRRSEEQPETRQLTYEGNPRDYELRTLEIEIETWLLDVINWLLVADLGWDLSLWFREALIRRARRAGWNVYTPRPSWPDGEKRVWKRKGTPYEVPQWERVK